MRSPTPVGRRSNAPTHPRCEPPEHRIRPSQVQLGHAGSEDDSDPIAPVYRDAPDELARHLDANRRGADLSRLLSRVEFQMLMGGLDDPRPKLSHPVVA